MEDLTIRRPTPRALALAILLLVTASTTAGCPDDRSSSTTTTGTTSYLTSKVPTAIKDAPVAKPRAVVLPMELSDYKPLNFTSSHKQLDPNEDDSIIGDALIERLKEVLRAYDSLAGRSDITTGIVQVLVTDLRWPTAALFNVVEEKPTIRVSRSSLASMQVPDIRAILVSIRHEYRHYEQWLTAAPADKWMFESEKTRLVPCDPLWWGELEAYRAGCQFGMNSRVTNPQENPLCGLIDYADRFEDELVYRMTTVDTNYRPECHKRWREIVSTGERQSP